MGFGSDVDSRSHARGSDARGSWYTSADRSTWGSNLCANGTGFGGVTPHTYRELWWANDAPKRPTQGNSPKVFNRRHTSMGAARSITYKSTKPRPFPALPPHTYISVPTATAECPERTEGSSPKARTRCHLRRRTRVSRERSWLLNLLGPNCPPNTCRTPSTATTLWPQHFGSSSTSSRWVKRTSEGMTCAHRRLCGRRTWTSLNICPSPMPPTTYMSVPTMTAAWRARGAGRLPPTASLWAVRGVMSTLNAHT
mmetsp:Transcript_17105/g.30543  ORF Transcript_17105/g.30543 Transcript_17105/m.30543 type:complete len:254 (-) Transcript_17105:218-979(-)